MADKLIYFPSRSRGEAIRMLMAIVGEPLDQEYMTEEHWMSRRPEFPMKQLPVLITADGYMLNQSGAICRHLARKYGLAGKTPMEETFNDMLTENCKDVYNVIAPYYRWKFFGKPKPAADINDYLEKIRDAWKTLSAAAEAHSSKYGGDFLNGKDIQLGDIMLYCTMESSRIAVPEIMEFTDWLQAFAKRFASDKRVDTYLLSRPKTPHGF